MANALLMSAVKILRSIFSEIYVAPLKWRVRFLSNHSVFSKRAELKLIINIILRYSRHDNDTFAISLRDH